MKYPIGIQDFEKIIEGGYVYLDKTGLVYDLVHNGTIYFLSRPRRFGKSLLVSTLKCYFEGKKELFKGLAIDKLEKEWKQYPVFHLDFNGNNFTNPGELELALKYFVERQEAIYGKDEYCVTLGVFSVQHGQKFNCFLLFLCSHILTFYVGRIYCILYPNYFY